MLVEQADHVLLFFSLLALADVLCLQLAVAVALSLQFLLLLGQLGLKVVFLGGQADLQGDDLLFVGLQGDIRRVQLLPQQRTLPDVGLLLQEGAALAGSVLLHIHLID